MKIKKSLKFLGLAALTLSVAVGCATAPKEEPKTGAADAIAAAKAANKKAKSVGFEWRDTGKMIKKAEKALKEGDDAKAIKLANKAKKQAESAVAQYHAETKRFEKEHGRVTGAAAGADSYVVMKGDSLWKISGKAEVYGNPYQWPLIFKANQAKIKDADLIFPGQMFDINRAASASDVAAAVRHAKTRGAWSIGVVEESDKAFLAQ